GPETEVEDEARAGAILVLNVQRRERGLSLIVEIEKVGTGVVVSLVLLGVEPELYTADHFVLFVERRDRLPFRGPPLTVAIVPGQAARIRVGPLVAIPVVRHAPDEARGRRYLPVIAQIHEVPLIVRLGGRVLEVRPDRPRRNLLVARRGRRLETKIPEGHLAEEPAEGVPVRIVGPAVVGGRAVELGIEQALAAAVAV